MMLNFASELGFVVSPIDIWSTYLSRSITRRLSTRGENFQYQSAAFHIANFPRSCAQSIFPEESLYKQRTR